MEFLGLAQSQLLTLLAAFGAGVVVLYILKLRRRRVPVPFARLWARVLVERPTTTLFARLKRWLSLLLQLLLLALLVGALGDPRLRGASRPGRSVVLLLDGSASMKATDVPGGRARIARDIARRIVRELGPNDRLLLAQMDAEVTALSPMTDDAGALEQSLAGYEPRDTGADFAHALRFAQDALRGMDHREIIVVGDGAYDPPQDALGAVRLEGTALRFEALGRRGRNVGITAFAVRRYPLDKSRYEVMLEVRSWSDRREVLDLTLLADGAPVEVTRLQLDPGATVQRVLPDQSGANEALEARLARADGSHDDLPADDRAYATLPERRRARILAVGEGNRYLEAALLLDEYLDVQEASLAEAPQRLRSERFDVVIFDGATLPVPSGVGALYLRPEGEASPREPEPAFAFAPRGGALGFSQVQQRHPMMRWTRDLEGAHIGRIRRYHPRPEDQVLGSSEAGPLVIAGERSGGRFVLLSFDVRESDLPLLVSWPVLVINAMDWFTGEDANYLSSFRTGEVWRIPVPAGVEHATLTPANGGPALTLPVVEGRAVVRGTRAGLFRLRAGPDTTLLAGNLSDPSESQCAPRPTLTVDGVRATRPTPGRAGVRRELWGYLVLLALGILFLEWITWHRRVTV
ncbi:MAG: VWA domain-containing protein [Deltaproteobacteria bacterium]|nr:VWA domain-containing protein [Deltaproteobacteria bacterium]